MPEGKYGLLELVYFIIHYLPYVVLGFFVLLAVIMVLSMIADRLGKRRKK